MPNLLSTGAVRGNALGTFLAQALNAMNIGQHDAVDSIIRTDGWPSWTNVYVPQSGTTPAYTIANRPNVWTLVLIDGARTFNVAQAMYAGYTPGLSGEANLKNSWAQSVAAIIQADLTARGWWNQNARFTVGGFSAGGMVGSLLAYSQFEARVSFNVCCHTFGSPRVTSSIAADAAELLPMVRWMWNADPVPLLPLRFTDAPWILPVVGIQGALNAGRYVHWKGGWQLVAGAIGHPEDIPSVAAISPVTNLATWLTSEEGTTGQGHSIGEYMIAMQNEQRLYSNPNVNPTQIEAVEPAESQTRRLLNQQERATASSIATIESRQNATPVAIPSQQVFQAIRFGRTWVVAFGGVTVAIAGSKKAARGLARQMNLAFRRLQRTAVVDPTAMQTQLGEYLAAASDPAGGFVPVLNTAF